MQKQISKDMKREEIKKAMKELLKADVEVFVNRNYKLLAALAE